MNIENWARGYFDYQATTPTDPKVLETMLPFFSEHFGNPASSAHAWGWKAESAVQLARAKIAKLIGATPREILFTSGATESNNLALRGFCTTSKIALVCSAIEHKATLDTAHVIHKQFGNPLEVIAVDSLGFVNLTQLERAMGNHSSGICSLIAGNNEIGTLQKILDVSKIVAKKGWIFHLDAVQIVGKIPIDVQEWGVGLLSLSGHKMYGPKGIGALYVRRKDPRVELTPLLTGGGQEYGLRSGTLAVPLIVGFGKAAELAQEKISAETERLSALRNKIWNGIQSCYPRAKLNGPKVDSGDRLPHNLSVCFEGLDAQALILELKGFGISMSSACGSGVAGPSHVLKAIGCTDEQAFATLRFGLGRWTSERDVANLVTELSKAVKALT